MVNVSIGEYNYELFMQKLSAILYVLMIMLNIIQWKLSAMLYVLMIMLQYNTLETECHIICHNDNVTIYIIHIYSIFYKHYNLIITTGTSRLVLYYY